MSTGPATAMKSTAMPNEDVLALLGRFIAQTQPQSAGLVVTEETELLGSGLLDSLAVIHLVEFVSSELGVEVGDEDFTPENFATAGALARLLTAKRSA